MYERFTDRARKVMQLAKEPPPEARAGSPVAPSLRAVKELCDKHKAKLVVAALPLYSNAAGMAPVLQALVEKGAALGTALAFMMAVVGVSLPETIMLRRVLRPQLIATFVGVVTVAIILIGYLFNALL